MVTIHIYKLQEYRSAPGLSIYQNSEFLVHPKKNTPQGIPSWCPIHTPPIEPRSKRVSATIELELVPGLWRYQPTRYRDQREFGPTKFRVRIGTYCWWFRIPANQLGSILYPTIYRVIYIYARYARWCRSSSIDSRSSVFFLGGFQACWATACWWSSIPLTHCWDTWNNFHSDQTAKQKPIGRIRQSS